MAWQIDPLLREAVTRKASDLHLSVGLPPVIRLHGELIPLEAPHPGAAGYRGPGPADYE